MTVRFVKTNGNCEQFKVLGNYKVTYVSDDKWFVTSARNRMITVYHTARRGGFNLEDAFFQDDFVIVEK